MTLDIHPTQPSAPGAAPSSGDWPLVSVLFVTYNRYPLLKHSIAQFLYQTDYPRLELVITDDGSPADVQDLIRGLPATKFSLPDRNSGLGANNNNGLRLCSGDYVLMLQDDWVCRGPADFLAESIRVMRANPDVGRINFGGSAHPVDPDRRLAGSTQPCYVTPRPLDDGTKAYFLYSDQPHLVSRAALDHVGLYKEDRNMEACERDYELRWARQDRFLTAVFPAYHLKAFSNEGVELSFRTRRLRNRVYSALVPAAQALKSSWPFGYRVSKAVVSGLVGLLEKTRLAR